MAVTYTQKIDPNSPTGTIGGMATRGGVITLNTFITNAGGGKEMFKWLHIGTAGNIVIEGIDGNVMVAFNAFRGLYIGGFRVLTSGVVDGNTYTTTAANITWHGGK
jgi:hypothetical protein